MAAADLIDAKGRDDIGGAALAAAGMIPGGGKAARGAALAMDEASKMARAKEIGFRTDIPLYHGTGQTFSEFKAVPTNAAELSSPGVSLAVDPVTANEFAAAPGNAQASPQVYKLLHRTDNPVSLRLAGDEDHHEVVATLRDAFDRGHDAVMLGNYTSPGGKTGDIIIVKDANQLRSANAAFDPARRNAANLLAGFAGVVPLGAFIAREVNGATSPGATHVDGASQ